MSIECINIILNKFLLSNFELYVRYIILIPLNLRLKVNVKFFCKSIHLYVQQKFVS